VPTFDSVAKLMAYIENAVQFTLGNEVRWVVQAEEAKQIEEVVYDAYEPLVYKRRWDMNNLNNIEGTVNGMALEVENITPLNTYYEGNNLPAMRGVLAEIVETGDGYDYFSPGPRPFTKETVEALKNSKDHVKGLKDGLEKAGLTVR